MLAHDAQSISQTTVNRQALKPKTLSYHNNAFSELPKSRAGLWACLCMSTRLLCGVWGDHRIMLQLEGTTHWPVTRQRAACSVSERKQSRLRWAGAGGRNMGIRNAYHPSQIAYIQ